MIKIIRSISILLFYCLGVPSMHSWGQHSDGAPVGLAILADEPVVKTLFKFDLPLVHMNISNVNLSMYDVKPAFNLLVKNRFMLNASYSIALFDQLAPEIIFGSNTGGSISVYDDEKTKEFSAEGTYFFKNKMEKKDLRIVLRRGASTEYVTYVPGTLMKSYGARLGITKGVTWYGIDQTNVVGTTQSGVDYPVAGSFATYMDYMNLRIGFGYAKSSNLHVYAEGYGYKFNVGMHYFYADALLNLNSKFDDIYSSYSYDSNMNGGTSYMRRYEIDSNLDKMKMGFALGYRLVPYRSEVSFNLETGVLPGIKKEGNGYLKLGIAVSIGNSVTLKEYSKRAQKEAKSSKSLLDQAPKMNN
jgi:hypothetical protein